MPLIDGKWHVTSGDCLWKIAQSVYGNASRWPEIADANGIPRSTADWIYPGQVFVIPGISSGSSSSSPSSTVPNTTSAVTIDWFALDAGTTRQMFAAWSYDRSNTRGYLIKWEYNTGEGGWRLDTTGEQTEKQSQYTAPEEAKQVRFSVTPKSDSWSDGTTVTREYSFLDNPPGLPPSPEFDISITNKLTCEFHNIEEDINAQYIQIAIYQDDTYKWKTMESDIKVDQEGTNVRYASFTCDVDEGHRYKIRARSYRKLSEDDASRIYGGWTDFTSNDYATPIAPKEISVIESRVFSEQMAKTYGVYLEWDDVENATIYTVQWVTNINKWDTQEMSSRTTDEGEGPHVLLTNLDIGHEYFFRIKSINNKGYSRDHSSIRSITIGTKPIAPTTYSNVSSCVLGEDLNLYWVHNSTDGSVESYARLYLSIRDSAHPELEPTIIQKVIPNEKPEEERNKTSVYTINTDDPEWATIGAGYVIKWKVQTAGVTSQYSDWSVEREVNVYAKPEIEIDLQNYQGQSVDIINMFPFYLQFQASPAAQVPISYYVEIVSNTQYEIVDSFGKIKMVNIGDKIYQRYYDPQTNPWRFLLEMTPGNIDLKSHSNYTVNATVSMNSGLNATSSKTFDVVLSETYYDVYANLIFNKETLEMNIQPYCKYYDSQTQKYKLAQDCSLAVYRRQYDGTFVEIGKDIDNEMEYYITDPHPSLDYGRYRVVAKNNENGSISYADIPAYKIEMPYAVIQWKESWEKFQTDESGNGNVEPAWSGSMLKIPYNITVSDSKNVDVSLVKYVGRENPVSYYGTQVNETSQWTMEIPKEDKDTLYAIRRLSRWNGDVYVREPSGLGYWANISVSYNLKYKDVVVPITMNINRVEGDI